MGVSSRTVRSRVRTQWLALGAAFVVLAGVVVAWALANAADRVQVVRLTHDVPAGEVIDAGDLGLTAVAFDAEVRGLVPAASAGELVGRVAAVDLTAGAVLQVGMWRDAPDVVAGEERVGAVLRAGRFPAGITRGATAVAASVAASVDGAADGGADGPQVEVRVLDVAEGPDGSLSVTLAVPAAMSVAIARLAATDQLLLVGRETAVGS